jgi:lysophospholipase L1-like esterase
MPRQYRPSIEGLEARCLMDGEISEFSSEPISIECYAAALVAAPASPLSRLMLIDASNNSEIGELVTGSTVDQTTPDKKIAVRADVAAGQSVGSVQWALDGVTFRTETSKPFAVANDTGGKLLPWTVSPGEHTLTVTPFSGANASGAKLTPISVFFTVAGPGTENPPVPPPVPPAGAVLSGMTVIDAVTNQPIGALADGTIIDLSSAAKKISVRADVIGGATVGSVQWLLNGQVFRTESSQPFAVANDSGGKFLPWNIAPGQYTLTVIPWSGAGATGTVLPSVSATFTVQGPTENPPTDPPPPTPGAPSLSGMTLMKGGTSQTIGAFANGAVLDLNTGTFSVRADVAAGSTVSSVMWSLDGKVFRTENSQPFAVANDEGGKFLPWNVAAGNHTLTVTPYSGTGASGTAGAPISVNFSVKAATNPIPPTPSDPKDPSASVERQTARHQEFLNRIKQGPIDLLFLGDSITDWFDTTGKSVYDANYGQHKPANFGISGDKTQNVIWRITHGELDGINPDVLVLNIGTNNLGDNPSDTKIADGIKKIVAIIRQKLPSTKILLLGIFPRNAANDPRRERIKNINGKIDDLDDGGQHVKFLDIGKSFLDANGNIPTSVMADGLHPTAKGYQIWADAMRPTLQSLMS